MTGTKSKRTMPLERRLSTWLKNGVKVFSRTISWSRWQKRAFVMSVDAILAIVAVWLAFSLRLGEWRLMDWPVVRFAGSMILLWYPVALWRRVYHAIFRYTGRGAIVSLAVTVGLITVPLVAVYMIGNYPGVPRTIPILAPMIFFLMMCLARIVGRYFLVDLVDSGQGGGKVRRVLVYGAGRTGQQLASSFASERNVHVVGFLDDDPNKNRQNIDRRTVYSAADLDRAVSETEATDVILAMRTISRSRRREILSRLEPHSVGVSILPPVRDLLDGRIDLDAVRPIQVEDLLGRNPIKPHSDLLRKSVAGKTVLVTGGGGSIGSEICRQIIALEPKQLIVADFTEHALFAVEQSLARLRAERACAGFEINYRLLNITNATHLNTLFDQYSIGTIYHAAAYKHVPLVERNAATAIENNIIGTHNLAACAVKHGVERFILISTDKAVRPPNIMGASKRVCELILQRLSAEHGTSGPKFAMVRFGNVLGSSGSVVPTFRQQIEAGGPVTVTHREMTRYFMTIPEAAQLVIQAGGMAEGGEVFLLDMGEPVKIWDLAKTMISLAGFTYRETTDGDGEIEIREVGLRSAEKLYEELLVEPGALPTQHPQIMRAKESLIELNELSTRLDGLVSAIESYDKARTLRLLSVLVPTIIASSTQSINRNRRHSDMTDLSNAATGAVRP